jgi:hypothetical protein
VIDRPKRDTVRWPSRRTVVYGFCMYAVCFMAVIGVIGLVVGSVAIVLLGLAFVALIGIITVGGYGWFTRVFGR